jgi:hypothetical protein
VNWSGGCCSGYQQPPNEARDFARERDPAHRVVALCLERETIPVLVIFTFAGPILAERHLRFAYVLRQNAAPSPVDVMLLIKGTLHARLVVSLWGCAGHAGKDRPHPRLRTVCRSTLPFSSPKIKSAHKQFRALRSCDPDLHGLAPSYPQQQGAPGYYARSSAVPEFAAKAPPVA